MKAAKPLYVYTDLVTYVLVAAAVAQSVGHLENCPNSRCNYTGVR